jgi:hypothetical protein
MGESRWERERRHLNEDHQARRIQSKLTMGLLKSQERVNRLTDAIESAQKTSAPQAPAEERPISKLNGLGAEWMYKKNAILEEISSTPFLADETKAAWSRVLQSESLSDRDDSHLTALRFTIMLESARFDGRPGRWASLTELVGKVSKLMEIRVQARARL